MSVKPRISKLLDQIGSGGGGGGASWGTITGTVTDQTDLITYLQGNYWKEGGNNISGVPKQLGSTDSTNWGLIRGGSTEEYITLVNNGTRFQGGSLQPNSGLLYYKQTNGRVLFYPDSGSTSGGTAFGVYGTNGGTFLGIPSLDNSFNVSQYNGSTVYYALLIANGGSVLIGTNSSSLPTARFDIRTFSSSIANKAFRIQNSSSAELIKITEDGTTTFGGTVLLNANATAGLQAVTYQQMIAAIPALPTVATTVTTGSTLTYTGLLEQTQRGDTSGGIFTTVLPTAVGNIGYKFNLKKIGTGINAWTIACTGGQTIDGSATIAITVSNVCVTVQSDGTNWIII